MNFKCLYSGCLITVSCWITTLDQLYVYRWTLVQMHNVRSEGFSLVSPVKSQSSVVLFFPRSTWSLKKTSGLCTKFLLVENEPNFPSLHDSVSVSAHCHCCHCCWWRPVEAEWWWLLRFSRTFIWSEENKQSRCLRLSESSQMKTVCLNIHGS